MALYQAPRGTQDFLPETASKLAYIEGALREVSEVYGFGEVRTPMFEHTELFTRSVGETTDVVQKEMYTFEDKKGRSITLKPEGTAGAVRMAIEHGLLGTAMPLKYYYITPCFRYEKQQSGRYRQFHQYGVELFGSSSPYADSEVIMICDHILQVLGVKDVSLRINSIGCPKCRPAYHEKLRAYFEEHRDELCETCLERLEKNPLRLLDCKVPSCRPIADKAPIVLDSLCEECSDHFEAVKQSLDAVGFKYEIDPGIVRGLDYYTKTVFEFVSDNIGTQGTICGGGRYDGLFEELGGASVPGVGFAMGLERLLMVMQASGAEMPPQSTTEVYIAPMTAEARPIAAQMTAVLRMHGVMAETDLMNRALKSQLKYADKTGAKYTLVLGEEELKTGLYKMKNMQTGETTELTAENYADRCWNIFFAADAHEHGENCGCGEHE